MKTTQTFSILIWANGKKATQEGLPIFARITIDGKRAEISLKKKVLSTRWDSKAGCVKGNSEDARTINNYIAQVKSELFKLYNQMLVLEEHITAETLKLRFTGVKEEKRTLLQLVDYHNDQMEKVLNIDVVKATHTKYLSLRKKLADFISYEYKKSDIELESLNHKFVTDFEYYLKASQGIAHNTTMKYIKNLKKIINLALQNEWLTRNPFSNFKCSYRQVDKQVLSIEEVTTIETKNFRIERLQHIRDLFVFSCYTGLAYIDVMNLTPQNIVRGIDGNYWVYTSRQKTENEVHVPLLPKALAIIEKYKNNPAVLNSGKLLPHYSNQKLNSYLKEIADLCEIEKNLTFHLARHTFATTITLTNGVPIETVSKLLGHSSIRTTQIYAKVVENKISEDMNQLKSRLQHKPKFKVANL